MQIMFLCWCAFCTGLYVLIAWWLAISTLKWLLNAMISIAAMPLNTLRLRQNGRHFPDDIFKWIFFNENVWILIKISLKFVPKGPINKIPAGDKPLSEPMMVSLLTHICVTQPQWVKKKTLQHYISGHIDGLVKDCSISSALAMEILQFCTKPLICKGWFWLSRTKAKSHRRWIICGLSVLWIMYKHIAYQHTSPVLCSQLAISR